MILFQEGKTALDIARERRNYGCSKVLERHLSGQREVARDHPSQLPSFSRLTSVVLLSLLDPSLLPSDSSAESEIISSLFLFSLCLCLCPLCRPREGPPSLLNSFLSSFHNSPQSSFQPQDAEILLALELQLETSQRAIMMELRDNAKRLEQEKVSQPLIPFHLFRSSSHHLFLPVPFLPPRESWRGIWRRAIG
jgi:hypothetical protein